MPIRTASPSARESYVIFGNDTGFPASPDLDALDGTNGFRLVGVNTVHLSGGSVEGAGDVNGDGFDDLIVGASGARDLDRYGTYQAGASYVIFGSDANFSASLDLAALNGSNGFRLDGIDGNDRSGASVAGAGDVNGDGTDDLIISAPYAGGYAGEGYVIFGSDADFAASLDLSALDGSNGFRLDGVGGNFASGFSIAGAGDVNGDGIDDLIVGAPGIGPELAGESYVVFGTDTGFPASLELSALDGSTGFRLRRVRTRLQHFLSCGGWRRHRRSCRRPDHWRAWDSRRRQKLCSLRNPRPASNPILTSRPSMARTASS